MAHRSPTKTAWAIAIALLILVAGCSSEPESLRIDTPATSTSQQPADNGVSSVPEPERADSPASSAATEPTTTATEATTAPTPTTPSTRSAREGGPRSEVSGNLTPVVVSQHPHDETSWTQGLEFHEGRLLESTGRYEQSTLRFVDIETGVATELIDLPDDLYAEGVTVVDGQAVQITWQDRTVVVTELANLSAQTPSRLPEAYAGEGWGLCYNGTELVMSNGTDQLTFRDPETFDVVRTINVTINESPLEDLNELECVGGRIWANVWQTTTIVAINADSGDVEASVDARNLVPAGYEGDSGAVLNGIAYNPESDTFWVTGKLWPVLYEVTFEPA